MANGLVLSVAVQEQLEVSQYSLTVTEYLKRGIQPPIEELPDFSTYLDVQLSAISPDSPHQQA
jgi:hypothetical protein